MPPTRQHNSWALAVGKGLNTANNNSGNVVMENDQDNSGGSASKVMKMDNHVNESQIAAAYSEGWGQRGVNQDTAWDVPSSPQCSPKEGSTWTSSTSTGTEIWENNVRHNKTSNVNNSGQVREPWGHTPTSHIGGTWGEEEDTTNFWTGVPPAGGPAWGGEASTTVWNANPGDGKNWGNQNAVNSPAWAGDTALPIGLPRLPMTNEAKNIDDNETDNGGGDVWVEPSHKRPFGNWAPATGGNKKLVQPSGWEEQAPPPPPVTCQSGTNFDDGTAVWGNPVHQGKVSHWKEMPANKQMPNCVIPPSNLCGNVNPCAPHAGPGMIRLPPAAGNINKNDNSWMKNPSLPRGLSWTDMPPHQDMSRRRIWDDIHSPLQEKNVPGAPNQPNSAFGNWGEPSHPVGNFWGTKTKNPNSTWADGQVDTSSWVGPLKQGGKPLTKDLIWASKQFRLLMEMNFKKDDIENALRRNNMNLEETLLELHALNSKENNVMDMDGLTALNLNQTRLHHTNIADDLNFADHNVDSSLAAGNLYGTNNFPGMAMFSSAFNVAQNCKNQGAVGNSAVPNVLSNTGPNTQVPNFNLNNGINNLSPAMMRKILQQNQTFNPACLSQNTLNAQAGRIGQQNFPSSAHVRHLVQQIQMAVQAGHLNPQILSQPLAPQTLQLLYQLLQQIRVLQQLQQQQLFYTQHGNKPGSPPLQLSVQITQTKQHVLNLQNQIAAQQAIFLKQQNLQLPIQHPSLQTPQPSTFDSVKSNLDSINGLHSEFRDLSVKDSGSQSHSRLIQWKLPSFDKDDHSSTTDNGRDTNNANTGNMSSEFSRAPGSVSKSSSANCLSSSATAHTAGNLQSLEDNAWPDMSRPQKDTWSETGDSISCSGSGSCSDSINMSSGELGSVVTHDGASKQLNSASDSKDAPATSVNPSTSGSSQSCYNLNDLVPEFEPGKPWKGTSRIKNFEDDPHVTPGSIAKSPLSLNSIKDSELFTWNVKSNPSSHNLSSASSLTSSTWSFSPPQSSAIQNCSSSGKPIGTKAWGPRSSDDRMPWKGSPLSKTRGPPPGLTGQNKPISSNWMPGDNNQGWSSNAGWEKQSSSNFLVLRNLTPQIDGSTLKTLCLQHGPLQLFHLLLNHGIALVRYSSREESEKARSALNNCVFSNTTILVDIPTENEVKQYLQLAGGQMSTNVSWPQTGSSDSGFTVSSTYPLGTSNSGSNLSGKIPSGNWNNSTNITVPGSNLWSFSCSGNSLWGIHSSSDDHDPCIPSSLNSFLPGDLLGGGESI